MGQYGHKFDSLIESTNSIDFFIEQTDLAFKEFNNEFLMETSIVVLEVEQSDSVLGKVKNMLIAFFKKVKEIIGKIVDFFKSKFKAAIGKLCGFLNKFKGKNYKQRIEKIEKEASKNEAALVESASSEEIKEFLDQTIQIYPYKRIVTEAEDAFFGRSMTVKETLIAISTNDAKFEEVIDGKFRSTRDSKISDILEENIEDLKETEQITMKEFVEKYADDDSLFNLNENDIDKCIDGLNKDYKFMESQIKELESKPLDKITKYSDLVNFEDEKKVGINRYKEQQKIIMSTLKLVESLARIYHLHGTNYLAHKDRLEAWISKHELKDSKENDKKEE